MSASIAQTGSATGGARDGVWAAYRGWLAGLLIALVVLAIGAGLWFHYHP